MALRTGIYIVPTHRWYIERTVWLIAGFVLLTSTVLALLVNPLWILGVTTTGLVSINVALTGFCPVGNVLRLFGFTPMLGADARCAATSISCRPTAGILSGASMSRSGINIALGSVLFLAHSLWWALFTGFVGAAMVWFAATGYCILANILYWIGAEPRLNPESMPSGRCANCAMSPVCISNPRATPAL